MSIQTKRLHILSVRDWAMLVAGLLLLTSILASSSVFAIARGYTSTDPGLKVGMVAALTSDTQGDSQVERATQENTRQIVGVVASVDDSFVTVASSNAKAIVETEGEVGAYVSDMGGEVTKGSLLALSPIKGVLMKVPESSGFLVVGVASEDVAGKTDTLPYQIDSETVKITKIQINLSKIGADNGAGRSSLTRLGEVIVGKEVSEIRVLVALILFLIVLCAEGAIMYGAISSAITALGRNPLAREAIRKELLRIVLVALAVFAIGLAAIYAVLWI